MRRALFVAVAALAATAPSATAAETCTSGSASQAAGALYGGELVSTGRVAGVQTALALEPRIAPGTRRRMVRAQDGRWCDAAAEFNASGLRGRQAAVAFASLAAAPYFDDVTVRSVEEGAPGAFTVKTHARTNGVTATWLVLTDGDGVRAARWTATGFGVRPFEAQTEGLTALPGAFERYTRAAGGLLQEDRGLPTPRGVVQESPGLGVEHVGSDGFRIVISYGDGRVAPQVGQDTGVKQVDIIRRTHRTAGQNYEEFLRWGFTKGWGPALATGEKDVGFIYINDALSLVCLACVFIADDFQIHMNSEVDSALTALGYKYFDYEKAYSNIIGHEMFHNFQNRYTKPGPLGQSSGRRTSTAYAEGTARFQETLHDYSEVSFQPESLVFANDANGCNGFDGGAPVTLPTSTPPNMDNAMASGIFGKTYNSCYFWMPFYVSRGQDAFLDLVTDAMPAASVETDNHKEGIAAASAAAGTDFATLLEAFAVSALTGRGNAYPTWEDDDPIDWSKYLQVWRPATLSAGETAQRSVSNGGMMAVRLRGAAQVTTTGPEEARFVEVRDDGRDATVSAVRDGHRVKAPRRGERVHVVGMLPQPGSATLGITAG